MKPTGSQAGGSGPGDHNARAAAGDRARGGQGFSSPRGLAQALPVKFDVLNYKTSVLDVAMHVRMGNSHFRKQM